jgi:hypothetical protein
MSEADALFGLIQAEPTLLDPAPGEPSSADVERRHQDEVHTCLHCGREAACALVIYTQAGARWLDLCPDCYRWVRGWVDEPASGTSS